MYARVTGDINDFQPVRRSMIRLECICSFDRDKAVDITGFGRENYLGKTEDPFD
jgi:hypothetical protein